MSKNGGSNGGRDLCLDQGILLIVMAFESTAKVHPLDLYSGRKPWPKLIVKSDKFNSTRRNLGDLV